MSTFWKPNTAASKSELDIFAARPIQTQIENWNYELIYPLNNVQQSSGPIEFHIKGSAADYLDLDNTLLCIKVKVVKSNGNDLLENDNVAPINNWGHSLFSDISMWLNETLVEGGNYMYPYKAYLTNLLLFGENAKRHHLQLSGYAKDEAGKFEASANTGFVTRKSWIKKSRVHDMVFPLHLDMCQQGKLLISNVDVLLKLTPSKASFNLIATGTNPTTCNVKFEQAYLKVRRVQVAPDTIRQHEQTLMASNALYPIQRTIINTYTIASGSLSHVKENLFHGQLPKMIILGMVTNEDFNGQWGGNPFFFRHRNVTNLGLYIDGKPVPGVHFSPDFENSQYSEEYSALMDALELSNADADIGITRNDFGNGYALFAFNLSPDKVVAGHGQPLRDGNLRIEIKFSTALDKAINVVTLSIYDDEIQISRLRKVTANNLVT